MDDIELHDGAVAPPLDPLRASVDIRSGSCPNPLNLRASGVLPVAVSWVDQGRLGQIDPSSATLEGIRPYRAIPPSGAAAPQISGGGAPCACEEVADPGAGRWLFLFPVRDLAAALSAPAVGETRPLHFSALLDDGTPVEGQDCVKLVGPPHSTGSRWLRTAGMARRGEVIEFAFSAPEPGVRAVVAIFSVDGRLVRRIESQAGAGGQGLILWDGRDGGGRAVSPGVYFVRADLLEAHATQRVVLMP